MAIYVCLCLFTCLFTCFCYRAESWRGVANDHVVAEIFKIKIHRPTVVELLLTWPHDRSVGHLRCQGSKHNTGGLILTRQGCYANFHTRIEVFCIFEASSILHGEDKSREMTIRYWEMLHSRRRYARFPTRFHTQALTEYGIQGSLALI